MLPPDEEVEKEAHPKDGARIEGGSQESSLLPIRALQSLVQTRGMVACRRSGGEEGGREGGGREGVRREEGGREGGRREGGREGGRRRRTLKSFSYLYIRIPSKEWKLVLSMKLVDEPLLS